MKIQKLYLLMFFMFLIAIPLNAEDIKIGGGVGKNESIDLNLHFGLYSFGENDKFTIGAGFNAYATNSSEAFNLYKTRDEIDKNDWVNVLNPIINQKSKYGSLALITMQYDVFKYRGLYLFGGIGYGFDAKGREDVDSVISVLDQINRLDVNDPIAIANLSQNQEFLDALTKISQGESLSNFIDIVLPNSQDLIDMINTPEKINNLINNPAELDNFLTITTNRYNYEYPQGFQLKSSSQGTQLVCDTLLLCKQGVAYQLGVGYDLQLIGALGLDLYAKMQGIFIAEPNYSSGINIILKF
jgi:hypothetical protein